MPSLSSLAQAVTVSEFARALATVACDLTHAHGARVWVGVPLQEAGACGGGLTLSDGTLAARALATGQAQRGGMLSVLPFGSGVLELIGATEEGWAEMQDFAAVLGLALEGVQAREARRGKGRIAETVEQLVRRLGGSLDLGVVLRGTAESAAEALGFSRAFIGLFSRVDEAGAVTGDVFTYGFDGSFDGSIGVGPVTFETLVRRGEAIRFERSRDEHTPLALGLQELSPEAAVIAPLSARGRPLGLLYVDTRRAAASASEDDARLVLALAEQASLAIDNARRYALETRKRRDAEALREVGAALSQSLHLSDTLLHVLEGAQSLFQTDAAAVYERQSDGRSLRITSALGLDGEYVLRTRAKVGLGLTGQAAQTGEVQMTFDLTAEPERASSRAARTLLARGEYPYRGVLALPLRTRGQLYGVLTLYWHTPLPLGADELALASVFAAQASLAIENARLYEEEMRREREAAVLLGVGRLLGEDQSGAALAEAVRLAALALNAGRGLLVLDAGAQGEHFATYNLYPPAPDEIAYLVTQLGRGPRPLTRRVCLSTAGSGLIVPLLGGESGREVLGFLYFDAPDTKPPSDRVLALARSVADQMALTLTRERLLSALEREEARYRQLTEGAHDLILSADLTGAVTYANPAALRLLEPLRGPLLGASLLSLATPDTREALRAAWDAALAGSAGGRAEIRVADSRLEVRLSAVAGEAGGVLLVGRDLSELQTLADLIAQRGQELKAATSRTLELRQYLGLFTQAQEEERKRISRELHDDTAQVLTATTRRVSRLARELQGEQKARADDILSDLSAAIESVRRFARNLRPSVLDDLGLLPALEWLAGQAQTHARLEVSGNERRLSAATELTVFRLAQEALSNVDKHADARSAAIRITFLEGAVRVAVSDDGRGFTEAEARARAQAGHLGLLGLRERVALAGGQLTVESAPGQGTVLTFLFPTDSPK